MEKSDFENADVTSDYGPRNAGKDKSKFHLGLDLKKITQQKGDAILSNKTGTIKLIRVQNLTDDDENQAVQETGLKYIVFSEENGNTYGYLHVFENGLIDEENGMRVGNFVLKKTQEGHWAIIDLINCKAISDYSGDIVTYSTNCTKNSNQTNTYKTANKIGADAPIGPIGMSNKKEPAKLHLHLSYLESGNNPGSTTSSIDPWTVIEHPKTFFQKK
jgi:hypothetical protein